MIFRQFMTSSEEKEAFSIHNYVFFWKINFLLEEKRASLYLLVKYEISAHFVKNGIRCNDNFQRV